MTFNRGMFFSLALSALAFAVAPLVAVSAGYGAGAVTLASGAGFVGLVFVLRGAQ